MKKMMMVMILMMKTMIMQALGCFVALFLWAPCMDTGPQPTRNIENHALIRI
jgi:uncharacterized lipoprotein YajG